ncbi:N-acetylmuramic acid 6-phosphate etherase [candidate division KSB1 bacterium]
MDSKKVFEEISRLMTEKRNPASEKIDSIPVEDILHIISCEDKKVVPAVAKEIPYIKKAVRIVVEAFKNDGRLLYVGAGTSGRLGILDAAECPPTFGSDPEMVQGIIAGGYDALVKAVEGSEDFYEHGARDLMEKNVSDKDVVCGIAASRRTPYVVGAVEKAKETGAKTIYVTCNPRSEMNIDVDVAICPVVGPEVIMGSTRMKSGTAQKLVLNMITTASMIRIGKVYKNMMVDLQMNSQKLKERSKRTLMMVTGVDYEEAEKYLLQAGGSVKIAIVMIFGNVSRDVAVQRLNKADGFVRNAINIKTITE